MIHPSLLCPNSEIILDFLVSYSSEYLWRIDESTCKNVVSRTDALWKISECRIDLSVCFSMFYGLDQAMIYYHLFLFWVMHEIFFQLLWIIKTKLLPMDVSERPLSQKNIVPKAEILDIILKWTTNENL